MLLTCCAPCLKTVITVEAGCRLNASHICWSVRGLSRQHNVSLHFIQLFLCELHETYDVQELSILPVNYVDLLIEIMLAGVFWMKVGVIYNWSGGGYATVNGLQRLLLMCVSGEDHDGMEVEGVKGGGYHTKSRWWDHGCFINYHKVILLDSVVDVIVVWAIHRDVKGAVRGVRRDIAEKDLIPSYPWASRATWAATRTDISSSIA